MRRYLIYSKNGIQISTTQKLTQEERKILIHLLSHMLQVEFLLKPEYIIISYDNFRCITGLKSKLRQIQENFTAELISKSISIYNTSDPSNPSIIADARWISSIETYSESYDMEFEFSKIIIRYSNILYSSLSDEILSRKYCYKVNRSYYCD